MNLGLIFTTLAYLAGALVFFLHSRTRRLGLKQSFWLLFAALAGGIFGAKLVRLLFAAAAGADLSWLAAHPDGRTIIGGILCGWLAVALCKRRLGIVGSTGDSFALALSLGEALGRIGCFFNACCCGAVVSSLPWAVYQDAAWRHPAQIYSALCAFSIFLLLVFLRKKVKWEGDLFRIYVLLEGSSRFLLEFARDRTEIIYGLSMAQWVCLELVVSMLIAVVYMLKKEKERQSAARSGSELAEMRVEG